LYTKFFDADIIPLQFTGVSTCPDYEYGSYDAAFASAYVEVTTYGDCYNNNLKPVFTAEADKSDAEKDQTLI